MPSTNEEAALELDRMRRERDLTYAWIARRIGKTDIGVRRKLNSSVSMTINDYSLLHRAITSVPTSKVALFN